MAHRRYKLLTFLLALLLAASSWAPTPSRAEAQMRCAGASPQSRPCAHIELPAAGLSNRQVYGALMTCCRSMHGRCPMRHSSQRVAARHSALSARPCLVSVHVAAVPTVQAAPCARWLLTAAPAPSPIATAAVHGVRTTRPDFWMYSPALSPHAAPHLHGLRAPPAA